MPPRRRPRPRPYRTEPLEPRRLLATLSGTVFNDLDADGLNGRTEPGLFARTVYVDRNENGVLDGNDLSAATNSAGNYTLSSPFLLGRGSYIVRQVVPSGWRLTAPADGFHTVSPAATSDVISGIDFGNTQRALVRGRVFNDADGDGRSEREGGIAGRTVFADANNNGLPDAGETSDTTDASGDFALAPPAGAYAIGAVPPAGWRQTTPALGSFGVTLSAGQVVGGLEFGDTTLALLTGRVFNDADADGTFDATEVGLAARTVWADLDGNTLLGATEPQADTAADGGFRIAFAAVPDSPYGVLASDRRDWRWTEPRNGTRVLVFTNTGQVRAGLNFGSTQLALVSGTAFEDEDDDGALDAGEGPVSNITVFEDANRNETLDAGEASDVTGPSGAYRLDVPSGERSIRQVRAPGWRVTDPPDGHHLLTFVPAEVFTGADFANTRRARVAGAVFEDADGDGQREPRELPQTGVTVYIDSNDNGFLDEFELSDVSGRDGDFVIEPGVIVPVAVKVRTVHRPGWFPTTPAAREINLVRGGTPDAVDFGFGQAGRIDGRLFHDLDADGVDERDEPGITGWVVYEDRNGNNIFEDGQSSRSARPVDVPIATSDTRTVRSRVEVADTGAEILDVKFSVQFNHPRIDDLALWLISPWGRRVKLFDNVPDHTNDSVFLTLDDGASDPIATAEPPLGLRYRPEEPLAAFGGQDPNGQWTLEVFDGGSTSEGTLSQWSISIRSAEISATTRPFTGTYTLSGVAPGARVVRLKLDADWERTLPPSGEHAITVPSLGSLANIDFGLAQRGSMSGATFQDLDLDGVRGPTEPALPGTTVFIDVDDDGLLDNARARVFSDGFIRELQDASTFSVAGTTFTLPGLNFFLLGMSAPSETHRVIDVKVTLNIAHSRVSDLSVSLITPGFGVLLLSTGDVTGQGMDGLVLDDAASSPISAGAAPYTGPFRPTNPLATLEGGKARGLWMLVVQDNVDGGGGFFLGWSIDLTYGDPRRVSDAAGAYNFDRLDPGKTHVIRPAPQAGWRPTTPPRKALYINSRQAHIGVDFGSRGVPPISILGRHVFYNNSAFDGHDPAPAASDDNAIAPDKSALRPGQPATFANYTSYSKGINGLMIDVGGGAATPLALTDFNFEVTSPLDPAAWETAPAPSGFIVRRLEAQGRFRVSFTWPDGLIRNTWLKVTVLSNTNTDLPAADVFLIGNLVGKTGALATATVGASDVIATRGGAARGRSGADNPFDHDRDGYVNIRDQVIVRSSLGQSLARLTFPVPAAATATPRASRIVPIARTAWMAVVLTE